MLIVTRLVHAVCYRVPNSGQCFIFTGGFLGDKIVDLLEYFLSSCSELSSTFYNKWLRVCIEGLIRSKVFKIFRLLLVWFWPHEVVLLLPERSTMLRAGVTMLKSITPHNIYHDDSILAICSGFLCYFNTTSLDTHISVC
jgi:hypothetical protein